MIPIYICDDNLQILNYIRQEIQKLILINEYDMEIAKSTDSPEKLLEARISRDLRSIYFLDIDLKSDTYNGFTLAKEIRKIDARGFIVFVTTHSELMPETFKYRVEAMNYIVKDSDEELREQIAKTLKDINSLRESVKKDSENYYTIKVANSIYHIPMEEILFFETSAPHRVTLHCESRNIEFRSSLSKIEKELPEGYIRAHQSFIVNREAIFEVNKIQSILILKDGSEIPISRRGKRVLL